MSPRFPVPAYTDLDQQQLFERLVELTGSVYPNLDLDTQAELARLFFEGEAYLGGIITDLMRRKGGESRVVTAEQRRNILAGVKLLGFRPIGATAAIVTETFTLLSGAAAADVTLPVGTPVHTEEQANQVTFQVISAPVVIPAGQTSKTGTVEHSTSAEEILLSNGKPNQEFQLVGRPFLDGSLVINTAAGVWVEVPNFLDSKSTDRHFTTIVDAMDRCTVRFGGGLNGGKLTNGAIPQGLITFDYKTGGGAAGKLAPGALSVIDGSFTDANGNPVRIGVTNAAATTGGEDRQSNALIQLLAPQSIRVPVSSVAREDYEIVAEKRPGVGRALHLTRNQDPAALENEGWLYVVPVDGSVPTLSMLIDVAKQFGDEVTLAGIPSVYPKGPFAKTVTFQLRVVPPVYVTMNVFARVYLRQGYKPVAAKATVMQALEDFFAVMVPASKLGIVDPDDGLVPNPLIDFGFRLKDADGLPTGSLARSDIMNAVRDAAGIIKIGPKAGDFLINDQAEVDPPLLPREFPKLGTVTLIDGKTGYPL